MKIRKSVSYKKFSKFAISAIALACLGCGSSSNGVNAVVVNPGGTGDNSGGGSQPAPIQPKTFSYPSFNSDSKLTVVANFQTPGETPSVTGTLTAALDNFNSSLPVSRALSRSSGDPQMLNPCGFPDADAWNRLLEPTPKQQAQEAPVLARYQELAEGARRNFILIPAGFQEVEAEKVLQPNETIHCTIFAEVVDDQPIIDRQKALRIAQAFDSDNPQRPGSGIYDQVRNVFGSEWNQNPPGGNDGDQKIVLFFFSSQTVSSSLFGYVSPADSNPNGGALSNKGEIIYINGEKSEYQTLATLSHEFQHVVNQNQKVNQQGLNPADAGEENVSLNEGLSGLAEEVCGYTFESGNDLLAAVTNAYLEKPERHEFFNFYQGGIAYGQGYLFFKYVREHFGDQTIRAISTAPGTGLANLDQHLPGGFSEIFRRWTIANYATNLNGPVPAIFKYPSGFRTDGSYPAGDLKGVKTFPLTRNQAVDTASLRPWSASYLTLEAASGSGLSATITPASAISPFAVIFESITDSFTSVDG